MVGKPNEVQLNAVELCVRARFECHFEFIKFDDWQMPRRTKLDAPAAATNQTNDIIIWHNIQHLKSCSLVVTLDPCQQWTTWEREEKNGNGSKHDLGFCGRTVAVHRIDLPLTRFGCTTFIENICSSIEFMRAIFLVLWTELRPLFEAEWCHSIWDAFA